MYNTLKLELRFTSSWQGKAEDWKLLEALDHPEQVLVWLMETDDLSGLAGVKTARPFGEIWAFASETAKLAKLDRLPACRWLSIDDDELSLTDYAKLIALAPDVEELTVPWRTQHEEIADAVMSEIAAKMKHLVRLDFLRPLSGPGLKAVAQLANSRHLATRTAKIDPADVEPLARLTQLETLSIWPSFPLFDEPEAAADRRQELPIGNALAGVAARLPLLRVLTQRMLIGPEGVASLAGAKTLRALDAELAEVDDHALSALAGITELRRLQLNGEGKLSPSGFAKVQGLRGLIDLALPGAGVTDQALEHLRPLTKLRRLSLRGGSFHGTGFAGDDRSADSPRFLARLSELDISGSQFNDDGCRALARQCPKLWGLDASRTKISDAGLQSLAGMMGPDRLYSLYLAGTKITDAGLAHFQAANFQYGLLYLPDTAATPQGFAALRGEAGPRRARRQRAVAARGVERLRFQQSTHAPRFYGWPSTGRRRRGADRSLAVCRRSGTGRRRRDGAGPPGSSLGSFAGLSGGGTRRHAPVGGRQRKTTGGAETVPRARRQLLAHRRSPRRRIGLAGRSRSAVGNQVHE